MFKKLVLKFVHSYQKKINNLITKNISIQYKLKAHLSFLNYCFTHSGRYLNCAQIVFIWQRHSCFQTSLSLLLFYTSVYKWTFVWQPDIYQKCHSESYYMDGLQKCIPIFKNIKSIILWTRVITISKTNFNRLWKLKYFFS